MAKQESVSNQKDGKTNNQSQNIQKGHAVGNNSNINTPQSRQTLSGPIGSGTNPNNQKQHRQSVGALGGGNPNDQKVSMQPTSFPGGGITAKKVGASGINTGNLQGKQTMQASKPLRKKKMPNQQTKKKLGTGSGTGFYDDF